MKLLSLLLVFILGVALTVVMLFIDAPFWFIYLVVIALYFALLVLPQMYIVYRSNNLRKIERFLEKNKRKPMYAYPMAVKTGNKEEIIAAIQVILTKYKQPYIQEVYKTNLALYEKNISLFEQQANQISKEPLHTYYRAYAEAVKGNYIEANTLKEKLPHGWMPPAIEAIIAKEKGDTNAFRVAADQSIQLARGIQKFNLLYSFEWIEKA